MAGIGATDRCNREASEPDRNGHSGPRTMVQGISHFASRRGSVFSIFRAFLLIFPTAVGSGLSAGDGEYGQRGISHLNKQLLAFFGCGIHISDGFPGWDLDFSHLTHRGDKKPGAVPGGLGAKGACYPALRLATPIAPWRRELGAPASAACWARLFRAYGARFVAACSTEATVNGVS